MTARSRLTALAALLHAILLHLFLLRGNSSLLSLSLLDVKVVSRLTNFLGRFHALRKNLCRLKDHGVTVLHEGAANLDRLFLGDLADLSLVELAVFIPEGEAGLSYLPLFLLCLDDNLGLLLFFLSLLRSLLSLLSSSKSLLVLLTALHDSLHSELFLFLLLLNLLSGTSLDLIDAHLVALLNVLDEGVGSALAVRDAVEELELARGDREVNVSAGVKHVARVRYEEHSALVLVTSGNEGVHGLEVQEVGRLVHDKEVRAHVSQLCKDHTCLLSTGEALHTSVGHLARHSCLLQVMAELSLLLFLWVLVHHPFEWSHFQMKLLSGVLAEICKLESFSSGDGTSGRVQSPGQELEESGLTSTVRSHNTHTSLSGDGAVGGLLEDLHICALVAEGDILHVDQLDLVLRSVSLDSGEWGRIREGEHITDSNLVKGVVLNPLLVVCHAATNRSRWVRVTVASDEALPFLVLLLVVDSLALFERLEVHLVVVDLFLLDKHNGVTHILEELSIVGHQQEGSGVTTKAVLEPEDGWEVQVVGRLVEEEKVR
mmetsp:Transcript_12423/g.14710  ORF Transcript_12423/g.14710 Transcript_12423/m.14710 type:complete len:544 (-) Transcript_12423:754-2385(-)